MYFTGVSSNKNIYAIPTNLCKNFFWSHFHF